jgi:hypothetical protein
MPAETERSTKLEGQAKTYGGDDGLPNREITTLDCNAWCRPVPAS